MDDEKLDYNEILSDLGDLLPIMDGIGEEFSKEAIALILQEKGYLIVSGTDIYLSPYGIILIAYNEEFLNLCRYLGIFIERGPHK